MSDDGYDGLVIVNKMPGSGMMLDELVNKMNDQGLAGWSVWRGFRGRWAGQCMATPGRMDRQFLIT